MDESYESSANATWNSLVLSEQQSQIIGAFESTGELMKLFEAGARLRNQPGFPGRMYLIGHAMREVINRIPEYYYGRSLEKVPKYSAKQIRELFGRWNDAVGTQVTSSPDTLPQADRVVTLPYTVAVEVHDYIAREAQVLQTRRERLATFLGAFQNTDPIFMKDMAAGLLRHHPEKYAHLPDPPDLHLEEDLLEAWDRFEAQLYSLCGWRHKIYNHIDADLETFNAQ